MAVHHLTARGRLIQFDCLTAVARVHVKSGAEILKLLIRHPDRVQIRSGEGHPVNMKCGAQDTISIEYIPAVDSKHGTIGDVQTVEFLK
jgi:hypothetical protein